MTTRSGTSYTRKDTQMADGGESVDMAQMLKALLEDRKRREEEWAEERRRREEKTELERQRFAKNADDETKS